MPPIAFRKNILADSLLRHMPPSARIVPLAVVLMTAVLAAAQSPPQPPLPPPGAPGGPPLPPGAPLPGSPGTPPTQPPQGVPSTAPASSGGTNVIVIAVVVSAAAVVLVVVVVAACFYRLRHASDGREPLDDTTNDGRQPAAELESHSEPYATNRGANSTPAGRSHVIPALQVTKPDSSTTPSGSVSGGRSGVTAAAAGAVGGSAMGGSFAARVQSATPSDFGGISLAGSAVTQEHVERQRMVDQGEYQKGKLLGRGANGAVYAAILNSGATIAMKTMMLDGDGDHIREQMRSIGREMDVIRKLSHPNLVTYYGTRADWENHQILIFMELVSGGSLGGMVRSLADPLNEVTCKRFVAQITAGLAYMHSKNIVHRDLKSDNVLFDSATGTVKIADFGTAKVLAADKAKAAVASTIIGTPYFMAPEMLLGLEEEGQAGYATKVDVWSLGIMVGELMNRGQAPWPSFSNPAQAFMHIATPTSVPQIPERLSEAGRDFMRQCTLRDPQQRPSAEQLQSHPWIVSIVLGHSSAFSSTSASNSVVEAQAVSPPAFDSHAP